LVILALLVFFLVPIVPYTQSVTIPGRSGEASLGGMSTPSYALLGYGSSPFPSSELVTVGSHSAIVFFRGSSPVAIEDAGPAGAEYNPSGVVWVQEAEVTSFDFGLLNVTVHLQDFGLRPIDNASVLLSMFGYSTNSTAGGMTLIQPKLVGDCQAEIQPGGYCTVSVTTPNLFPENKSIDYYPEVRGFVNGTPFVYREGFTEGFPTGGVGPIWVRAFLDRVDNARGAPLTENSTLDQFAALRFKTASAGYQISDYGFANDTALFFGANGGKGVTEELLFPGDFSPDNYPVFLADYAIGHWESLLDGYYTQFGFYVGHGPYYYVSVPCSIYEVPGAGINIPQFFQNRGCTTTVISSTWLVIVLGP